MRCGKGSNPTTQDNLVLHWPRALTYLDHSIVVSVAIRLLMESIVLVSPTLLTLWRVVMKIHLQLSVFLQVELIILDVNECELDLWRVQKSNNTGFPCIAKQQCLNTMGSFECCKENEAVRIIDNENKCGPCFSEKLIPVPTPKLIQEFVL